MEDCTFCIDKRNDEYKKILLNGVIYPSFGKNAVIYDSRVLESYGMISFINESYCLAEVYKNADENPVATIYPGDSFVLTSNPLCKIKIKFKSKVHEKCESNKKCSYYKSFNNLCYDKCQLYYRGFVYVMFNCNYECINQVIST